MAAYRPVAILISLMLTLATLNASTVVRALLNPLIHECSGIAPFSGDVLRYVRDLPCCLINNDYFPHALSLLYQVCSTYSPSHHRILRSRDGVADRPRLEVVKPIFCPLPNPGDVDQEVGVGCHLL